MPKPDLDDVKTITRVTWIDKDHAQVRVGISFPENFEVSKGALSFTDDDAMVTLHITKEGGGGGGDGD